MIGLVFAAMAAMVTPTPVRAALPNLPEAGPSTWGVSGLQTGTETDGWKSPVFAMERVGDVLFVGGRFTHVTNGDTEIAQPGLAAFNADTGDWIDTFRPRLDGAVYALKASPDGQRLFVGGDFDQLGETDTGPLMVIDPVDGSLDRSWSGEIDGYRVVRDFDIDSGWLYVGGGFTWLRSSSGAGSANRVARFDLDTGAHDRDWLPNVKGGSVWGLDVDAASGRAYLAGSFTSIDGQPTSNGFASIDLATQRLTPGVADVAVNATDPIHHHSLDVLVTNGRVWVAGSQHTLRILDEETLELETFYLSRDQGDFQYLLQIGDTVYAGCHCNLRTTLVRAADVIWWGQPPDGFVNAPAVEENANSWVNAFDARTGLRDNSYVVDVDSGGAGVWALADGGNDGDGHGCVWAGGAVTAQSGIPQYSMTRICDTPVVEVDQERPSAPGQPRAQTAEPNQLVLSWRAATDNVGVVGYRLYDAATNAVLFETSTTSDTFDGVEAGTYRLYGRAYDAAGNISWRSGITTVTVDDGPDGEPDTERPSVPGRPRIVAVDGSSVELTWFEADDNIAVAGYRIYDRVSDQLLIDASTNEATISDLAPGTYRLYARAYDAAGNLSWRSGYRDLTIE